MPLTELGQRIMANMKAQYGERGEEVFYRSLNAGQIPAAAHTDGAGAFLPGELHRREGEEEDGLLAASGSPGGSTAGHRDNIRPWDNIGAGPFGATDLKETITQEIDYGGRDDEYDFTSNAPGGSLGGSTGGVVEHRAGDQENIGTLPGGGTLDPEFENPQEYPGEITPPTTFPGEGRAGDAPPLAGGTTGGLKVPYGDAGTGYGGIAGGTFEQKWGERWGDGPHPFADQLPGGMTQQEIFDWGRRQYWKQWEE